jgi:hypothetical protein
MLSLWKNKPSDRTFLVEVSSITPKGKQAAKKFKKKGHKKEIDDEMFEGARSTT